MAPLGNNAESSTPPRLMRPVEDSSKNHSDGQESSRVLRSERYLLQNAARTLLNGRGVEEGYQYPSNFHKTAKCLHTRFGDNVEISISREHKKAFYGGLVQCGSVWACPVCAAKVQERRRVEIAKGFDWAYSSNKKVIMVTFTFPHYFWQKLNHLLQRQAKAYKRLRAGNPWQRVKDRSGYVGLIRSLEITIGANGWHPHTHEAWIVDPDCDTEALKATVSARWLKMCKKEGLVPDGKEEYFLEHAVHIMDNCRTSDYLEKQGDASNWGVDREIAKGASKQGDTKSKGAHPFALLREFQEGNQKSGKKFLEYVEATKGRAHIFWSQGLKDLVGLDEKTDEEIAEEKNNNSDLLGLLTSRQWAIVIRNNDRARILDIVETQGFDGVEDYFKVKEVAVSCSTVTKEIKQTNSVKTESRFRIEKICEEITANAKKNNLVNHLIPDDIQRKVACFSGETNLNKWTVTKDF